jgi:hypothetical protein
LELDTGAAETVIPWHVYRELGVAPHKLKETGVVLKTYSGEGIQVRGIAQVKVKFQKRTLNLSCFVVEKGAVGLFGINKKT